MKGGIDRATRLASQLLALAREEHAELDGAHAPVALASLAQDVAREQAPIAAARDVDLGVTESAPVTVEGDPAALYTLIGNLVDNAVRYTPQGGRVDVAVTTRDGAPAIVVRDSGPGIPADERAHVFDRFARGAQASAPGSGLGLAIVRDIAELYSGAVALDDSLLGGLRAILTLPAAVR
jgi:two-component system OmpR family sensor kinase